ncbi:MAG TPA: pantetheine-phosphate adenylyltransferase [Candidatus Deferrimicrobiaceae bacterium]
MKTVAVYPGSFDPPTFGHLDIIERGAHVFSKVIVAVAFNIRKKTMFTPEERVEMLRTLTAPMGNVEVDAFDGLLADYTVAKGANVVLRGLRAISDFEYEFQMAHVNRKLAPKLDTVIMIAGEKHIYISSSIVKEVARLNGKIDDMVPELVRDRITAKIREQA